MTASNPGILANTSGLLTVTLSLSKGRKRKQYTALHKPLKIGTLSAILTDIADHLHIDKAELIERLMARRG